MFDDITGHIWYIYWPDLWILYFFPGIIGLSIPRLHIIRQ